MSFGYKHGLPPDADLVVDMRFLPNPHWIPELREHDGREAEVRDYVLSQEGAEEFLDRYLELLRLVGAGYRREGKRYLTVAVGCTGGKHRSVAVAEELARRMAGQDGVRVDGVAPRRGARVKAVALGGGHGLHATLSALRRLTDDITAVVVVADDGGSSGRIRRELDILPLGDLRMALGALAGQENPGAREHALAAGLRAPLRRARGARRATPSATWCSPGLLEVLDDPVAALDQACRLLGVRGRVLPMSTQPVDIEADVTGIFGPEGGDQGRDVAHRIRGQVAVATTPGRVQRVRLDPRRPRACPEACDALRSADVITLGPGSWFSSVLPHLLVPELLNALVESEARKVLVLNLAPQPGETAGFSPEQHLEVLAAHAPRLRLDVVVADTRAVPAPDLLRRGAEAFGADTLLTSVGAPDGSPRHDPEALAEALADAAHHRVDHRDPLGTARSGGTNGSHAAVAPGADPARPHQEEDRRWP